MKKQIFVSPKEYGRGEGSSPENAVGGLEKAVALSRENTEDVTLVLLPGEYLLTEPLRLDERDSGTEFRGENAVVTGVRHLADWQDAGDGIVCTEVPADARFTQFFVRGERRERARFPESGMLTPRNAPLHTSGWANEVTDGAGEIANRLLYFDPADLPDDLYRPEDAEFVILQFWMEARLVLEKMNRETGEALFQSGSWRPLTWSYGYYLENVREGLTAPGSWYHDRRENRIWYHLKDGEHPENLEAAYPVLRQLIEVKPGAGKTVRGLRFEGITFSGTDGHAGGSCYHSVQAETNAPVAVRAERTEESAFVRCSFSNLGGWALWLGEGCRNDEVERCSFTHCGAGAVRIGEIERPADRAAQTDHITLRPVDVITDKQKFFLSVGIGKFLVPYKSAPSVAQEVFFAISAQTPIYMALKGKRVGESITFNGVTQVVKEIL